jgi:hypothetical protein
VKKASNVPLALMQKQSDRLRALRASGALSDFRAVQLDQTLTDLANVQGACERIKNTPLPRQYEFYTRLFVYLSVFHQAGDVVIRQRPVAHHRAGADRSRLELRRIRQPRQQRPGDCGRRD